MDQQHFTDGIGRITVIGGIVRLDMVTYSATESDANGQPRPVLTQRLLMSVDAFLRSSEKILETVQAITKAQQRAVPAPAAQQPAPQAAAQHNPPPLPRQDQIAAPQPSAQQPSAQQPSAPPPARPKPFP
jgi:hypothetical protein